MAYNNTHDILLHNVSFEYYNKHLISAKGKCMKEADMFCQVALEQIFDWMLDVKLKH